MTLPIASPQLMFQIGARAPSARLMVRRAMRHAANDNCASQAGDAYGPSREAVLRAALAHFKVHGLGAARAARTKAESAFFDGDRANYDWWLAITRTLDRRLALEADKERLALEADKERLALEADKERLALEADKERLALEADKERLKVEAGEQARAAEAELCASADNQRHPF